MIDSLRSRRARRVHCAHFLSQQRSTRRSPMRAICSLSMGARHLSQSRNLAHLVLCTRVPAIAHARQGRARGGAAPAHERACAHARCDANAAVAAVAVARKADCARRRQLSASVGQRPPFQLHSPFLPFLLMSTMPSHHHKDAWLSDHACGALCIIRQCLFT
eukprot:987395-Pleurochrysis_carterae.AAC.2